MENATKALLIAGGVLIAIIIVSIAVYLFFMYSNQAEEYNSTISAVEINKFNSKFYVYVGREDITSQELVSVANLAKEYDYQIKIYLGTEEFKFTGTQEDFIGNNQDKTFSCIASSSNPTYDSSGKITKIIFKEN